MMICKRHISKSLGINVFLAVFFSSSSLMAQTTVVSDGTTGSLVNGAENVTCTSGICDITGGTDVSTSRFHSFEAFSLSSGDEARFESDGIEHIFTRITGSSRSDIDGLISTTTSGTDLFLLNPNGIIFGPNSQLNIGGSFIASTADSLVFDNGAIFAASPTQLSNSLLTINTPIGLQYGTQNSSIQVQGPGNSLDILIDPDLGLLGVDRSSRPIGLQVNAGETLALLSNGVTIPGGNLTAEAGHIEIGAVGQNSQIDVTPSASGWQFNYGDVQSFEDIRITQAGSLDVSGEGGGAVHLQGQNLLLRGGSAVVANTTGADSGNGITLEASKKTTVTGISALSFPSSVISYVETGAVGNGGSISITADQLRITNDGEVSVTTFGDGNTGTITLDTDRLQIADFGILNSTAEVITTGEGGDIVINGNQVNILDGGQISTTTLGFGDAGDISIQASRIRVSGFETELGVSSSISTQSLFGRAGDISLVTDQFTLDTGGSISAGRFGSAEGGNITLQADTVNLLGALPDTADTTIQPSRIDAFSDSFEPVGTGGSITITADQLYLSNGASVASRTLAASDAGPVTIAADVVSLESTSEIVSNTVGEGNAAELTITARQINVLGSPDQTVPTSILALAEPGATGDSGTITLQVDELLVQDGGQIAVGTVGDGDGGQLIVNAETISIKGTGQSFANGLIASANGGSGDGGDLIVNSDRLFISNEGRISASNLTIDPSNPATGDAGNVFINVPLIYLSDEGRILADTRVGDQGNLDVRTDTLVLSDRSSITTNSEGSPDGGDIEIDAGAIAAINNSDISANALEGSGGRVTVTADGIFGTAFRPQLTSNSDITASSALGPNFSGEVVINTPDVDPSRGLVELPNTLVDVSHQVTAACEQIDENTLVVAGAGGIPQAPHQTVQPHSLWFDIRLGENLNNETYQSLSQQNNETFLTTASENTLGNHIKEAQSWWVNTQGDLILGHLVHSLSTPQQIDCGRWNEAGYKAIENSEQSDKHLASRI